MSQSFYRKWRPRQWDEVVGQEHIVTTLRNAVAGGRIAHAYLFAGPRGTGKTTTARLLAKAVNCLAPDPAQRPCNQCIHCQAVNDGHFLDLIEIDAASNTSVEDVRDLRDKINFAPNQGKYKVYMIDEVHMLSTAAFNALLKTLEEPPPHAIFILATTEIHKIPATVLSRCQRHEFRRIPVGTITSLLRSHCADEGLQVEPEALTLIARQATGSLRDAISLLDQLASTGKKITMEEAQTVLGTATSQRVIDLVGAILDRDAPGGLNQIHAALDAGTDPRQFARQVVEYLRGLLLMSMGNRDLVDATEEVRTQMVQQSHRFQIAELLNAIRAFNTAALDERGGWQPGLPIELAFADSLEPANPAASPSTSTGAPEVHPPPAAPRPAASAGPELPPRQPPARPQTSEQPKASRPVQDPGHSRPAEKPAAEPPAAQPAPVSSQSGTTMQVVAQSWTRIRASIKKNYPQTEALLNSSKPLGIKEGTLLLGFSEVLKEKMESGDHIEITRQAIQLVLGTKLEIRCVVVNKKTGGGLPPDVDVDSDGIVGTATRDLGAEIVDVQ